MNKRNRRNVYSVKNKITTQSPSGTAENVQTLQELQGMCKPTGAAGYVQCQQRLLRMHNTNRCCRHVAHRDPHNAHRASRGRTTTTGAAEIHDAHRRNRGRPIRPQGLQLMHNTHRSSGRAEENTMNSASHIIRDTIQYEAPYLKIIFI